MSKINVQAYLAEHPRLIGYLFALGMVLSQAGNTLAATHQVSPGP